MRRCPRGPRGRGRAPDPRGHPIRRLEPFFRRKKANIRIKIVFKFQSNRSYGSPDIKETVKGQKHRTQKQRDRSNLGGALAPPTPWEPRTRGETLLPSREEVKEEEEEGGALSPLLPVAPERCRGPSSSPRSSPTPPPSSPTSPSCSPFYIQQSTLPQPAVPST